MENCDVTKEKIGKGLNIIKFFFDVILLFSELVCDEKIIKRENVFECNGKLYTVTIEKGDNISWGWKLVKVDLLFLNRYFLFYLHNEGIL